MLRFALFGCGRAGTIHARNIARHPNAKLGYVSDINGAAADQVVVAYGGRLAGSPEEIWASNAVNAVLIASSTHTHVDLLRRAIRAGWPTYCEKPIDMDIAKVKRVVAEAEEADRPIFIGFRRRFLPDLQMMHRSIQNGDLGRIETINMVARDHAPPSLAYLEVSGGFLLDKMIHFFDLAAWLAHERPHEVYAAGSCLVDPAIRGLGDIDTAMVILRFPGGMRGVIENGRHSVYGVEERIEVFGANGMLRSEPAPVDQVRRFTETGIVQSPYPAMYGPESFAFALDSFMAAVKAGTAVSPSLRDGLQAQLIAEAAVQSLRTNQPVPIMYDA